MAPRRDLDVVDRASGVVPDDFEVRVGDALEELKKLPDECVQTCVTSPPYWGLRSYDEDTVRLDPSLSEEEKQRVRDEMERRGVDARR